MNIYSLIITVLFIVAFSFLFFGAIGPAGIGIGTGVCLALGTALGFALGGKK